MSKSLLIGSPLAGWGLPLAEVPDPVFAERMAGDGLAIDPSGSVLHAPCDGEVLDMKGAKHAVTIRSAIGVDILMHVGIDTVKLAGDGFVPLVATGARVSQGQPLLRFELDRLVRAAPSLITPVVLASPGTVVRRSVHRTLKVGDVLMEITTGEVAAAEAGGFVEETRREFGVPFEHGLHVRPAALLAAALRPFASEVSVIFRGRSVNARSTVGMMSLGVRCGDTIEVKAVGPDGPRAIAALEPLLAPVRTRATTKANAKPAGHRRVEAAIASRGLAIGRAVQWTRTEISVAERGEGEAGETAALDRALATVREHLESLKGTAKGERQALLAAHAELVEDPDLRDRAGEWMRRGKSAAFSWRQATRAVAEGLAALDDPRMRERAADLRDLENQVLRVLSGRPPSSTREFEPGSILMADDVLPSQMISLDTDRVAGVCTVRGGTTSHVAILAAASGIPTLVAAGNEILDIPDGTPVVLDAEHGWLDVDPPATELAAMQGAVDQRTAERTADLAAAQRPARTRDGVDISVVANLGSLGDALIAMTKGAGGCGLLRTEFLFLDRREPPDEEEQLGAYQKIAAALGGKPMSIRTMDIGGDKPIPYLPLPREENPALGMRGLRASLWDAALLRTQLRAILRVQPAGQCRVLLPMVTDLEDLRTARAIIAECAKETGVDMPLVGAMIETPASALLAEQLVREADYLSIGTNDLSQYTLAIDRGHPELARRLDALHPAVLRLIALVAEAGRGYNKKVAVCGALGSDVDALPILIGLGVHEISATPSTIPRLKRTVRLLDAAECRELAHRALEQSTAAEVRELALLARSRARAAGEETVTGGQR